MSPLSITMQTLDVHIVHSFLIQPAHVDDAMMMSFLPVVGSKLTCAMQNIFWTFLLLPNPCFLDEKLNTQVSTCFNIVDVNHEVEQSNPLVQSLGSFLVSSYFSLCVVHLAPSRFGVGRNVKMWFRQSISSRHEVMQMAANIYHAGNLHFGGRYHPFPYQSQQRHPPSFAPTTTWCNLAQGEPNVFDNPLEYIKI